MVGDTAFILGVALSNRSHFAAAVAAAAAAAVVATTDPVYVC
jgi:hypothetical protein